MIFLIPTYQFGFRQQGERPPGHSFAIKIGGALLKQVNRVVVGLGEKLQVPAETHKQQGIRSCVQAYSAVKVVHIASKQISLFAYRGVRACQR